MKWIIGEPSQENVYTYSYWNQNMKWMDHWWTQSRKCIYLFLLKKIWNGSLVNPVKKMYIPIPTEIKYEMDHWWSEPSQENVYTYSYWNKIWNGSLVNPVKKMYIPIPSEMELVKVKKMYIPIPTEIKYEMDHWWSQSRKCIYLFLLK